MWAPFAELFGIRPWEFDRLTVTQFASLERAVLERGEGSDG